MCRCVAPQKRTEARVAQGGERVVGILLSVDGKRLLGLSIKGVRHDERMRLQTGLEGFPKRHPNHSWKRVLFPSFRDEFP